ncbi:hypothetical protein EJ08DRAFT_673951 [Tothia fuscella]|uniref:Uncharacterized protein n=1 Tax=Tothia fuscella TaxID=1048955 RepID=A0A9P4P4N2_9PEZI|nr:hypothetical protein EJ08DRAFT_673951 [Tothia fuscella]
MSPAPAMTLSRRSSLSNISDYSINLDALGPSSKDDSSLLPLPQENSHAIDVIHSEDIDGPTDFTQNMEYWMNAKLPNVVKPTKLDGERKSDLEEYVDSDESLSQGQDVTPRQGTEEGQVGQGAQDHDVDQSMMSDASFGNANEGGISFLSGIPEDEASLASPQTVERSLPATHPSFRRQPTVKDYDDTPIKPRESRSASSSAIGETLRSPENSLKMNVQREQPEETSYGGKNTMEALEEALEKLRTEISDVKSQSEAELTRLRQTHELQLNDARTSHDRELKSVETTWKGRLSQSKAEHESKMSIFQSQKDSQAQKITLLETKLNTATTAQNTKANQIASLEKQLSARSSELQESKNDVSSLERELDTLAETSRVEREELEEDRRELEDKYHRLQDDHRNLSSGQTTVHNRIEDLETQVELLKSRHEMEISCLKAKSDEATAKACEDFESEKTDFELKLDALKEERDALLAELALLESNHAGKQEDTEREAQISALQKERDTLGRQYVDAQAQCSRINTELNTVRQRHVKEAQTVQTSDTIIHLKSSNEALRTTITELQSAVDAAKISNDILRASLCDHQSIISTSRTELDLARQETESTRAEIRSLRADFEAVNLAVDKRVSEMIKTREAEWMKRFETIRSEKGIMGKVLMREWGSKEVGGGDDPQGYRYKFVRK